MNQNGKEFEFPRNVRKEYGAFKEFTLKDIVLKLCPVMLIGLVICLLPPYSILIKILEAGITLIAVVLVAGSIIIKPIKERPNIRYSYIFSLRKEYSQMQKLYFLKPKKERRWFDVIK